MGLASLGPEIPCYWEAVMFDSKEVYAQSRKTTDWNDRTRDKIGASIIMWSVRMKHLLKMLAYILK